MKKNYILTRLKFHPKMVLSSSSRNWEGGPGNAELMAQAREAKREWSQYARETLWEPADQRAAGSMGHSSGLTFLSHVRHLYLPPSLSSCWATQSRFLDDSYGVSHRTGTWDHCKPTWSWMWLTITMFSIWSIRAPAKREHSNPTSWYWGAEEMAYKEKDQRSRKGFMVHGENAID